MEPSREDIMDKGEAVIEAGAVDIAMSYRDDIPGDAGLCIQIYAKVSDQDTELLRFDCFANAPHYHYGPEAEDERLMFDQTAGGDPLSWVLGCFERGRLPEMITRAGYKDIAGALDAAVVERGLEGVGTLARELEAVHATSS